MILINNNTTDGSNLLSISLVRDEIITDAETIIRKEKIIKNRRLIGVLSLFFYLELI